MITWKPTGFYSRINTRDCLLFHELKYKVVNATKVVGEHSHPNPRVVLASLQAWHCRCRRCAGVVTNVALASLPSLLWHCSHPCKLATAHPRHSHDTSVCVALLSWSLSLPVASLPYLALFRSPFASDGPAEAVLVSLPALCLRPWLHCIAPSLLPVLRQHHFPCCVGAFVLVTLTLMPSLPLRCRQHRELASAQAQSSRNTCWCHYQHHALVVADVVPAPSPSLRRCLCPGCTGVAALGTPTLPPASQTGIYPVMTQLQPVVGEVSLLRCMLSPVALLLYPESAHSDFCLQWSGQGSNGVLLALSRCPCLHCTGVIASIKLLLLLALRRCCCRVALQGPAGAAQAFAGIALAFCPHPAGVIASIMLLSMSPALCRHHCHVVGRLCPCQASIFVLIAFALPPALQPCICSVTKQSQHALASLPALHHCHCRQLPALLSSSHGHFCPCSAGVANLGIPALHQHHKLAAAQS